MKPLLAMLFCAALICAGCSGDAAIPVPVAGAEAAPTAACPVTSPARLTPPEDSAVSDPPAEGDYFTNDDGSILASAWWAVDPDQYLRYSEEGIKTGWFRPAGEPLEISGRRLDGDAPPLEAHVPCCYPTRFQATGLYFPTGGCWEVNAAAGGKELTFVVWVAGE